MDQFFTHKGIATNLAMKHRWLIVFRFCHHRVRIVSSSCQMRLDPGSAELRLPVRLVFSRCSSIFG